MRAGREFAVVWDRFYAPARENRPCQRHSGPTGSSLVRPVWARRPTRFVDLAWGRRARDDRPPGAVAPAAPQRASSGAARYEVTDFDSPGVLAVARPSRGGTAAPLVAVIHVVPLRTAGLTWSWYQADKLPLEPGVVAPLGHRPTAPGGRGASLVAGSSQAGAQAHLDRDGLPGRQLRGLRRPAGRALRGRSGSRRRDYRTRLYSEAELDACGRGRRAGRAAADVAGHPGPAGPGPYPVGGQAARLRHLARYAGPGLDWSATEAVGEPSV